MDIEKDIGMIYRFVRYGLIDELEKSLELTDLEEIGIKLLSETENNTDIIQEYIAILNFIENESDIASPVSDDIYDRVVEKYKDLGGTHDVGITGNYDMGSSKKFREHQYPELRGSLNKVHFIHEYEVPEKDSRKSLEKYILTIDKELKSRGITIDSPITIGVDFKWDGASHVFEMTQGVTTPNIDHVLTRYDVGRNLGVDITHVFKDCDLSKLLFQELPDNINNSSSFGLKVETFMPTEFFQRYVSDMKDDRCNRRSAITSIVNQTEDQFNSSLLSYLAVQPLQIASIDYIDVDDNGWVYIGELNGRHQYIQIYTAQLMFEVDSLKHFAENLDAYPINRVISSVKEFAGDDVPIDGVVFTILDTDIIAALGRSGDKNRFQIAFKFPQGTAKTTLKDVEFPVGPTAATITPLAIVEPVVINGNTITNASLSNFDKMDRLDLNIGDDVIIKYDIIPKLEKDSTCKKGNGRKIVRPEVCPICNSDLNGGNRCMNPNCDAKLSGKIYNYLKKMKIKSIGKKTIEKFVKLGFLNCIGDLYRLPSHMKKIVSLPGFGQASYINMLASIFNRTSVYPHEFLGAIGIPDISIETMKKACMNVDLIHMSEDQIKDSIPLLTFIHGIGEITAKKIVDGILDRIDDIEDIIPCIEFMEYPTNVTQPKEVVLFSGFRDHNFAEFLEENNIKVASSYVKSLTYLIVPDDMDVQNTDNRKVRDALANGLPIITLSQSKKKFGYNR